MARDTEPVSKLKKTWDEKTWATARKVITRCDLCGNEDRSCAILTPMEDPHAMRRYVCRVCFHRPVSDFYPIEPENLSEDQRKVVGEILPAAIQ